jgi:hypothetical protein
MEAQLGLNPVNPTDMATYGMLPYDLSIPGFLAATTRAAASYGDNPFGVKLQRAAILSSVTFRGATVDNIVTVDANGSNWTNAGTNPLNITNHTINAAANALTVEITFYNFTPTGLTVKVGTTSLVQLGVATNTSIAHYIFGLSPAQGVLPTGTPTIAISWTGTATYISVVTTSFFNAGSFGTFSSATGSTAALSHTVTTGAVGGLLWQAFYSLASGSLTWTGPGNVISSGAYPFSSGNYFSSICEWGVGIPSLTFAASGAAGVWSSVCIPVLPLTTVGTTAQLMRNGIVIPGTPTVVYPANMLAGVTTPFTPVACSVGDIIACYCSSLATTPNPNATAGSGSPGKGLIADVLGTF